MNHRIPHYLKGTKTNEIPANVIFFDTETRPILDEDGVQHHYLWFGYACYQRREKGGKWGKPQWLRFTTRIEFWNWVIKRTREKTRLYMFAHNGAFDLPVLDAFSMLPALGYTLNSVIADAPPLALSWRNGKRTIKFIDTLNIWRLPLDQIGESIGASKLPMPKPNAKIHEWNRYGKQDVEVLRLALMAWFEFIEEHDLGGFAPTLASQAFRAYKHRFMTTPIFCDAEPDALELSRQAYVGGRTECFRIGRYEEQLYYVDVNSMYPAVMQQYEYPIHLLGVYKRPSLKELQQWCADFCLVAEVIIETDEPIYPIVQAGKLIYPVGRFRVTLAAPELMIALHRKHIKKANVAAVYEKAALFKPWVDHIFRVRMEARKQGNEVQAWLLKILMNSLYGKFGQRGRRYEVIDHCDPNLVGSWSEIDLDDKTTHRYRRFGGVTQELIDDGESRDSHPAIAAHVTSYARQLLWQGIQTAGRENCLYCDTDSLIVNQAGFDRLEDLIDSDRLGAWALEESLDWVELYGPKDYITPSKWRLKGVRSSAIWLDSSYVLQDKFVGLAGLLQRGSLDAPLVYEQGKRMKRVYTKGTVNSDGRVSPFRVDIE